MMRERTLLEYREAMAEDDSASFYVPDEPCRCGHPESAHTELGCGAPTRLVGDMTYAERPCYCETFSDCYEGDPS